MDWSEADEINWFLNAPNFSYLPPPPPPPSPENHRFTSPATFSLPQNDLNPDIFFNLEADFNRLNLSSPPLFPPPAATAGADTYKAMIDRYLNANIENLQRLRIESAVRGQMGPYMRPNLDDEILESFGILGLNPNQNQNALGLADYQYYNGNYGRNRIGSQNGIHQMRYGAPNNNSGRNGYTSRRRGRSGFGADNPVYDDNGSDRLRLSRQRVEELTAKMIFGVKGEEVEMIFMEVKDHVRELMVDQSGNALVKKLFEVWNADQMTQVVLLVVSDERKLMSICGDIIGTHSMQKLLEQVTTPEQRSIVTSALRCLTLDLSKNMNGYHVLEHCLKLFPLENTMHILYLVADNCVEVATDKSGCCALQHCVTHSDGEPKKRLLAEIIANALTLSEDRYGNYVVQYIIGMKVPRITAEILGQLVGNYVFLSKNKYGSNVVEKCLKESGDYHTGQIIKEIMNSPEFLSFLQDPYGNYVAQSALQIAKGSLHQTLVNRIQMHYRFLQSHPYGKRVLMQTRGGSTKLQQHHHQRP